MRPQAILSRCAQIGLAATLLAACGGAASAITDPTAPAGGLPDAPQLYRGACASCHGPSGDGGLSGVPLNELSAADRPSIVTAIRHGVGAMPASSDGMTDAQVEALVDYVVGLR